MDKQAVLREDKNSGTIAVVLAEKDMEAWADFMPPVEDGKLIDPDYVDGALKQFNIVYGIQEDTIHEATFECNLERRPVRDVLVAKGDAPLDEISEYFQINPHLKPVPLPDPRTGKIDYRSFSPFIIVKQNQALAKLRPHKDGKEGKNVHGDPISFGTQVIEGVQPGENTRIEGKLILSNINGQLVQAGNVLNVQDSLVIKGAVGYSTGNIIFPGDVFIDGMVNDGFKIYSGGSVNIKQTLDVTDVVAKADLTVAGGIIGRGDALVKVGGTLTTKFIENCRVAVRKNIVVAADVVNSNVFTLDRLEGGEKSLLMGGKICAVNGIQVGAIGKQASKPTHIHCGIDFTAQAEKDKCNNQLHILAAKMARLDRLAAQHGLTADQRAKLESMRRNLEQQQKIAGERVAALLGHIDVNENAVVEVTGQIAAGTLIEICQVALFVTEPLKKVRIKLDKAEDKLVVEPL